MFVTSFKLEYVGEHRSEEERNFLLTGEANLILKQRHVEDQTVKSIIILILINKNAISKAIRIKFNKLEEYFIFIS